MHDAAPTKSLVNFCSGLGIEFPPPEQTIRSAVTLTIFSFTQNHIYYFRIQLKWLESLLAKPAPRKANLARRPRDYGDLLSSL